MIEAEADPFARPDPQGIVRLGVDTERARRACARFAEMTNALTGAVRRSMPWVLRKRIAVTAEPPRAVLAAEIAAECAHPFHVVSFVVDGAHAGAIVLDAPAIARAIDGVLAGGGGETPKLSQAGLSPAQSALAARIGASVFAGFADALGAWGLRLTSTGDEDLTSVAGLQIACTIAVGEIDDCGNVTILVPAAALEPKPRAKLLPAAPVSAAALGGVHVDVIAELGRVPLSLGRVARLRVGDVLRLPLPVDAPARVHVGGRDLFTGTPTTRGHQIAIDLTRHAA